MIRVSKSAVLVAVAAMTVLGPVSAAYAQAAPQSQSTPRGWNYEIRDGKRVPKSNNRVTAADGSWREETRQGNCVMIKEGGADGSVKTTRKCD
jgi:hypothetical protein